MSIESRVHGWKLNCMEAAAPPNQSRHRFRSLLWGWAMAAGIVICGGCQIASQSQNASGVRYFETGQYTAAMQEFQKAISADPKNADSYYNLARVTHKMGVERNDPALTSQAEALYNQCLDHSPNHVDCHRSLAVLLAETGRPEKSFTLLKNWAAANPQLADARVELARLYQETGETQTAKKYLEDAVQQDPNSARAWLALGKMREASGELTQALANYQRSYSLNSLQPAVQERIAALTQQLSRSYDSTLGGGGTRFAQPPSTMPGTQPPGTGNVSSGRY